MGLTEDQKIIRDVLIEVAQSSRGQINYGDVVRLAGLTHMYNMEIPNHRELFGEELGMISAYEVENGRPMLSSVVYNVTAGMPGGGYFKLAESVYGIKIKDKLNFFITELNKTLEYWRKMK